MRNQINIDYWKVIIAGVGAIIHFFVQFMPIIFKCLCTTENKYF